jgi:hypothetical protein
MKRSNRRIEFAIEVFVRGHSAGRSRTYPYEVSRVGPLWLMRDAPRKNPRNYRKEEWIAHDVDPREVDAIARQHTRGRFFVCAMIAEDEPGEPTRTAYKALGYRLLATEGFFVQRMKRIPRPPSPALPPNGAGGRNQARYLMMTTAEPRRCKAARLVRWCLTGHDGAHTDIASTPVLGCQSAPIDPANLFQYRSLQPNILLNCRSRSRSSHAASLSRPLKSP